jgi:hypothetical protein
MNPLPLCLVIGSALGLAIMVAVSSAYALQPENSGIATVEALNSAFHLAFIGSATVAAVVAVVAFVAVKKADPQAHRRCLLTAG